MAVETSAAPLAASFSPTTDYVLAIQDGVIVRVPFEALVRTPTGDPAASSILAVRVNDVPNLTFDPEGRCSLIAMGSGAQVGHGAPHLFVHTGGGMMFEGYDYATDIFVFNSNPEDTLLIGAMEANSFVADVALNTRPGQSVRMTSAGTTITDTVGGRFRTRVGAVVGGGVARATPGGAVNTVYATTSTTHTDGTFDTLNTFTAAGNTLALAGDSLSFRFSGTFVGSATATRRVKLTLGGTDILDTTALASASNSVWSVTGTLTRVSATTVRYETTTVSPGLASPVAPTVGDVTGLTLSGDTDFVVSAAAAGTGAASADITLKTGLVSWCPAAVPAIVPQNLNPLVWLMADAGAYTGFANLATPATDSTTVAMLVDQSGYGCNMRWEATLPSTSTSSRPTYKTGIQNSLPGILFDGVDDFLVAYLPGQLFVAGQNTLQTPYSIYLVAKNLSLGNNGWFVGNGITDGGIYNFSNVFFVLQGDGAGPFSSVVAANTTYTIQSLWKGASSTISLNGGTKNAQGDGDVGAATITKLILGKAAAPVDPTKLGNFYFFEMIVFAYELTSAQEAAVLGYLRTKWGHY